MYRPTRPHHNLTGTVSGFKTDGHAVIKRFTEGINDMMWYEQCVHQATVDSWSHPILAQRRKSLNRFLAIAHEVTTL